MSEPGTHLLHLLQSANDFLERGEAAGAIRFVDRAWRLAPNNAVVLELYGQLSLHLGEYSSARQHLGKATDLQPSPGIEASLIESMLALGELEAAAKRLEIALHRFAVVPGGRLATAGRRLLSHCSGSIRGWVGVSPTLEIIGEVVGAGRKAHPEIRSSEAELIACDKVAVLADGVESFRLSPVPGSRGETFEVSVNLVPLIGSGLVYPPNFGLDGRATEESGNITGWAVMEWLPGHPVDLVVEDETGARVMVSTEAHPTLPNRWRFNVDAAKAGLKGTQLVVSAMLPDGNTEPLPDAPLLRASAISPARVPKRRGRSAYEGKRREIDIIVPVYRGHQETLACLQSLLSTSGGIAKVVVVDDASPDRELSRELDRLASDGSITLLRNEMNRGFPGAANRGLALHEDRDAVLLNADTIVHGDWLQRLRNAAYSAADIGTVTPWTNRGSIVSYPAGEEQDCAADEAAALDAVAREVNAGITAELPVGVGFCLYLRRDCLDQIGLFDAETFGKGYGEENDLCLRARRSGWRNVLAADVFVHHLGGRSFGRRRDALLERNTRILNLRYRGYDALVARFSASDPLFALRRRLDEARLAAAADSHVVLVSLALPGGVDRVVAGRCQTLRRQGMRPLVLKPKRAGSSARCLIVGDDEAYPDLAYDIPDELPRLTAMLSRLRIYHVELHHFLDIDPGVVESLIGQFSYDVFVHDYIWICPRLTLIGGTGQYCGEPAVSKCEACIVEHGSQLSEFDHGAASPPTQRTMARRRPPRDRTVY